MMRPNVNARALLFFVLCTPILSQAEQARTVTGEVVAIEHGKAKLKSKSGRICIDLGKVSLDAKRALSAVGKTVEVTVGVNSFCK